MVGSCVNAGNTRLVQALRADDGGIRRDWKPSFLSCSCTVLA